jgi:hypothetical protein
MTLILRRIAMSRSGSNFLGRVVVVCWTWRDEEVRLISARKATRAELREYQEE